MRDYTCTQFMSISWIYRKCEMCLAWKNDKLWCDECKWSASNDIVTRMHFRFKQWGEMCTGVSKISAIFSKLLQFVDFTSFQHDVDDRKLIYSTHSHTLIQSRVPASRNQISKRQEKSNWRCWEYFRAIFSLDFSFN